MPLFVTAYCLHLLNPAPTVSFVDSFNACMTTGWSVTVSGVNFGASLDTTPTSRLGLSDCGTTLWASQTSVVCFLTRGDGVEHTSTITAVSVVGTRTSTFSYNGPFPRETFANIRHGLLSREDVRHGCFRTVSTLFYFFWCILLWASAFLNRA